MRHRHAFRPARRSRRVDHVRQMIERQVRGRRRFVGFFGGDGGIIEVDHLRTLDRRHVRQPPRREQRARRRVADHVFQAIAGIRGVERRIRSARLQHGEDADNQVNGTIEADADNHIRPHAECPQPARERVGTPGQRPVGNPHVAEGHRDRVRIQMRGSVDGDVDELQNLRVMFRLLATAHAVTCSPRRAGSLGAVPTRDDRR